MDDTTAAITGVLTLLRAPGVFVKCYSNLFRDPRWGRGQEVPGEDPTLTSEYVMHYSRGMQEGVDTRYLKVISTTKHYADYDQEDSDGTNRVSFNAIVVSEQRVACLVLCRQQRSC